VADLQRLLDVQDRDLLLDQLRHRRDNLPDRAELGAQQQAVARVDRELATITDQLAELSRAEEKLSDEVETVDTKAAAETKKLNSGTITAPREIQALSDEIDALGRRKRSLEDDEIELMEKAEPLSADAERLGAERATAAAAIDRLSAAVSDQERAIDTEAAVIRAERDAAASDIPADLLGQYEKLRTKLDGVAVARLQGDLCLGCHVSLPAMEVDVIRHAPEGTVVTHEECGRILVR
jgi:predicted  nucleic acid-binding Zn-ribbon protein